MAVINPPGFLHNLSTHTAQIDRISNIAGQLVPAGDGLTWRAGLRGVEDYKVTAQGTPNMTVNVAAGMAFVRGTLNAFQGVYAVPNDGTVLLNVSPANPTLARHDLVIIRVNDAFYSGATNNAAIEIVTGTASATPADPTVPPNSLVLARITVGAGVTSIGQGVIADLRTWTASMGGCVPCLSTNRPTNPYQGMQIYETNTDTFLYWDGSVWQALAKDRSTPWQNITSFQNGWGTTSFMRIRRDSANNLHVQGKFDIIGTHGMTAFTLPVGFRPNLPAFLKVFASPSATADVAKVNIDSAGNFAVFHAASGYISVNIVMNMD